MNSGSGTATVKRFSDFAKEHAPLDGTKLKIDDILNKEITITGYRVKSSKYNNTTACLTVQFMIGDETHVAFTGSQVLLEQCKMYEAEIPFLTAIKKVDRYYSFT